MAALHCGNAVEKLRHRRRKLRVCASRRSQWLQARDLVLGQMQRLAIESAPGEAEPKLVHRGGREVPGVLGGHAVAARERIPDRAGSEIAAAIRQWRSRT